MITLLIGKSGAGKDTYLKHSIKDDVRPIVSYTTRPKRTGEVDGVDYNFVTDSKFDQLDKDGKMLETRSYNTIFDGKPAVWKYGSPKIDPSRDYIAIVDVDGAMSYIDAYGPQNIYIAYIYVDDDERKRRAIARGTFSEEEWNRRLKDDSLKFSDVRLHELEKHLGKPIARINNNRRKEV